jgi:hypothetical protein
MRIHEIEIGGKLYRLAFSTRALDGFCKWAALPHLGALFQKLAQAGASEDGTGFAFSLEELAALLMFSANEGARKAGDNERLTLEEAFDLMDERQGLTLELIEGLVQSIQAITGAATEPEESGEAKSR